MFDVHRALIQIDIAEKKPDAALARVTALVDKSPDDLDYLLLAGNTYGAVGKLSQAEKFFRQALARDASNLEAYRQLGNIYMAQKRLDDALREFGELAEKQPPAAVAAHTMLGTVLDMQQKTGEARKEYLKALELDPRAAVAANNLAWSYASAETNLEQAIQLAMG